MSEAVRPPAVPSSRPPYWANAALAQVILCLAIVIVYANSFTGPFVFDDIESIPENPSIQDLGRIAAVLSPPLQSTVAGRPILNLTLAINHAVDGLRVQGYHLFNIGFHLLAALALFGIVRRTLELPSVARRFGRASIPLAFATSLLWAVHPLHTGSVTYIIQRAESLMGLFYVVTLYCVIRAAGTNRPNRWMLGAIGSCALGMATKEAMVTAPILVLAYDRIFLSRDWKEVFRRRGALYAGLAATWIVLIATMFSAASRGGTVGFGLSVSWSQYAMTQFGVILHYLRLVVWPHPLVLDYAWPIAKGAGQIILPAIPVLGLLALSIWGLVRHPKAGFLGLAFFLILAPTSTIVPIRDAAFEHRMYLPLAAVLAGIVLGVYSLLARGLADEADSEGEAKGDTPFGDAPDGAPPLPAEATGRFHLSPALLTVITRILVASGVATILLGTVTIMRNRDYRSEVSIWQDTVKKRPMNWRAHDVLGIALARQNDFAGAIAKHTDAIRVKPDYAIAYYNRGTTYLRGKMFKEAIEDLSTAVRLQKQGDAYSNRAVAHFQLGDIKLAKADIDSSRMYGFQPHPAFVQMVQEALKKQAADSSAAATP